MPSKKATFSQLFPISSRDFLVSTLILSCAAGLCGILKNANSSDGFAFPVFTLAVLCVSRFTTGYLYGLIASIFGVVCVNFIFTYPYWEVDFTISGYPLTFVIFLITSIMTCALTTQVRQQERLRSETEKESMRANLLRSVSHDIRTPLTSIAGSTSAILENPGLPDADRTELLEDVRNEAQWLIRVVENLLSITRIGEDPTRITKEPEAAEEVLGEVIGKFRRHYPDVKITVSAPEELLMVPMDPVLIVQVLFNLLENAVLHGKTTNHIHLSLTSDTSFAYFTVKDNGDGIAERDMANLFSGALRSNPATTSDGKRNMGLGLSVCFAIVRAHGGTMSAKNLPVGAEFSFCLPLEP